MPRARSSPSTNRHAAALDLGDGCLSGFLIPPLTVLLVGILLAFFTNDLDISARAEELAFSGATVSVSELAPIFTPTVQYWADSITRWAAASNLDPNLVAVIMQIESCGDPRVLSHAGAVGLFQVMPYHFSIDESPYNPDTNAQRGLAYLQHALDAADGDPRLALAAYNGGIGILGRTEWTWAAETARYVKYGYPIYEDARGKVESSPMLEEWYSRYGESLCRQAAQRLGIQ